MKNYNKLTKIEKVELLQRLRKERLELFKNRSKKKTKTKKKKQKFNSKTVETLFDNLSKEEKIKLQKLYNNALRRKSHTDL